MYTANVAKEGPSAGAKAEASVSVIVLTNRRLDKLRNCLDSLVNQVRLPNEIIIVGTFGDVALESSKEELLQNYPLARIHLHSSNEIVEKFNDGLRISNGEFVFSIDDDGIAETNWIKVGTDIFSESRVGAIGGPSIPIGDSQANPKPSLGFIVGEQVRKALLLNQIDNINEMPFATKVRGIGGNNMAFRKRLVSGIDPCFRGRCNGFEDDIWLTIKEKGFKVVYSSSLVVYHDERGRKSSDPSIAQMDENLYNITLVFTKHLSVFRRIILLSLLIATDIPIMLRKFRRYPAFPKLPYLPFIIPIHKAMLCLGKRNRPFKSPEDETAPKIV
jgi:GT2 family glycosyltransferase